MTRFLILFGALLAAAPVTAEPSAAAPETSGVRIWLLLPKSASKEAIDILVQSEKLLERLIGKERLRTEIDSPDGARKALRYEAKAWQSGVLKEDRAALLDLLRGAWGGALLIEDPAAAEIPKWPWPKGALQDTPRKALDAAELRKSMAAILPEEALVDGNGAFYDGGLGKGSADTAVVTPPAPAFVPTGRYGTFAQEEAVRAGLRPEVVAALLAARGGARRNVMLVSRIAADDVGLGRADLSDPRMNIRAGARLLARFMDTYAGDMPRALAAFHAGSGAARKPGIVSRPDVSEFIQKYDSAIAAQARVQAPLPSAPPKKAAPEPKPEAPKRPEPPSPVVTVRVNTPFEDLIQAEAKSAGVDPDMVRAVVAAKSGFDPQRSGGGSHGLMMVTPGAAKLVGLSGADLSDPAQNIRAGSLLLARLMKQFDGDTHRALAAYQAGAKAVRDSGGIPNRDDVRVFLAAYEKAYRGGSPIRPPVVKVDPPKHPLLRQGKDSVKGLVYGDPKDPVAKWIPLIEKAARKHGMDAKLVESVMRQENPWGDPKIKSPAGATGLMQLMPGTAKAYGIDPANPEQNVDAGVRHLKEMLGLFKGDRVRAIAAYNCGQVPLQRLGRIPNYYETVIFVTKVFNIYYDLTGENVEISHALSDKGRRWSSKVLARKPVG